MIGAVCVLAAFVVLAQPAGAATFFFNNNNPITIPQGAPSTTQGPATPYPSDVFVSGFSGSISHVSVTLNGFSHACTADVDVLLVGPNGQNVMLMSDAGDCHGGTSNATLAFDDFGSGGSVPCLGTSGPLPSNTYRPTEGTCGSGTNETADSLPTPAPSQPYGSALSIFNGLNPNGTWQLYVNDDAASDTGSISGGWTLSLTIGQTGTFTSTTVNDAATASPWSGHEQSGASAYDTATIGGPINGVTPSGNVTYNFFTNGSCSGPPSTSQVVFLNSNGTVPNSNPTGPLPVGAYSYSATYSGDSNYVSSASPCEVFGVGSSSIATVVYDAASNSPWNGGETTGARAYDTASVFASSGFTPTGTVTYSVFGNGACSGPALGVQQVALVNGAVPNSNTTGPLAAGSYSFNASYSGDAHYPGSLSTCEPIAVASGGAPPPTKTSTGVASSINPSASGQTVTFTATVKPVPNGGTVRFVDNGHTIAGCATVPVSTTTGKATCNATYTSPGSHGIEAVYSGNASFKSSNSPVLTQTVRAGVELLGQTGFVSPSDVAGVFVGCFSSGPCSGSLRISFGNVTVASRDAFAIGSNDGGIVHISLTAAGAGLLAGAPGHHLPVTVTFANSVERFTVALTLVEFGSTVAGPMAQAAASAPPNELGLFGNTAFVSPSGVAGVLAACFSTKPCSGVLFMSRSNSTFGSRLFSLPADGGGILHVSLSAAAQHELKQFGSLRVSVTLTAPDGTHVSKVLTLVQFA